MKLNLPFLLFRHRPVRLQARLLIQSFVGSTGILAMLPHLRYSVCRALYALIFLLGHRILTVTVLLRDLTLETCCIETLVDQGTKINKQNGLLLMVLGGHPVKRRVRWKLMRP